MTQFINSNSMRISKLGKDSRDFVSSTLPLSTFTDLPMFLSVLKELFGEGLTRLLNLWNYYHSQGRSSF